MKFKPRFKVYTSLAFSTLCINTIYHLQPNKVFLHDTFTFGNKILTLMCKKVEFYFLHRATLLNHGMWPVAFLANATPGHAPDSQKLSLLVLLKLRESLVQWYPPRKFRIVDSNHTHFTMKLLSLMNGTCIHHVESISLENTSELCFWFLFTVESSMLGSFK